MTNLPLHPIAVHFPIAIGMLMPLLILTVFLGMRRWSWPWQTWLLIVILQFICVISSIVAVNLGERDEERPGPPLRVDLLEEHEELGEKVPWTSGALLIVMLIPIFVRQKQRMGIVFCLVCSVGLCVHLIATGHSGGKLVYQGTSSSIEFETESE